MALVIPRAPRSFPRDARPPQPPFAFVAPLLRVNPLPPPSPSPSFSPA